MYNVLWMIMNPNHSVRLWRGPVCMAGAMFSVGPLESPDHYYREYRKVCKVYLSPLKKLPPREGGGAGRATKKYNIVQGSINQQCIND